MEEFRGVILPWDAQLNLAIVILESYNLHRSLLRDLIPNAVKLTALDRISGAGEGCFLCRDCAIARLDLP